jgi:uncharacterized membrane protein
MKKPLPTAALAGIAVVAIVAIVMVFMNVASDPAPTATNVPDYSKMTNEQVAEAYAKSKAAEAEALKNKR